VNKHLYIKSIKNSSKNKPRIVKMNKCKQQGFTLIEVMIVVAILGIISAIAIPSYTEFVRKGKRTDAKVELLRIAQLQESYFVQNLSYASSTTQLGLGATVDSEQDEYRITISDSKDSGGGACTGLAADSCSSYTILATAQGSQSSDTKCGNFTITNTGVKGRSGSGETVKRCWK